jgi:hypothetical protein
VFSLISPNLKRKFSIFFDQLKVPAVGRYNRRAEMPGADADSKDLSVPRGVESKLFIPTRTSVKSF